MPALVSLADRWRPAFQPEHEDRLTAELEDLLAATLPADRDAVARRFIAAANEKLAYHIAAQFDRVTKPPLWFDREAMNGVACEALVRATRPKAWSPDYRSPYTGRPVRFSTYACRSIWSALERWRVMELRRGVRNLPPGVAVLASAAVLGVAATADREPVECPLRELGARLTDRERRVVVLLYGLDGRGGRRLRDVGVELGVSAEAVRQIRVAAVQKLRTAAGVA